MGKSSIQRLYLPRRYEAGKDPRRPQPTPLVSDWLSRLAFPSRYGTSAGIVVDSVEIHRRPCTLIVSPKFGLPCLLPCLPASSWYLQGITLETSRHAPSFLGASLRKNRERAASHIINERLRVQILTHCHQAYCNEYG